METQADLVINSILALTAADLAELNHKIRTTPNGIKAFQAFNFGALSGDDQAAATEEPAQTT